MHPIWCKLSIWLRNPILDREEPIRGISRKDPSPLSPIYSAVADIQAKWHTLPDFERAQAILPIIRAGVSRRGLAQCLHTSEGTIRTLLLILEADRQDQELFRRGEISRRELLRRVKFSPPFEHVASEPEADAPMRIPERIQYHLKLWLTENQNPELNAR